MWRNIAAGIALFLICTITGVARADERNLKRFEFSEPHMGTSFRLVLFAETQAEAKQAARTAFARVTELDNCLSDYKPTSELMQLCQKAGGAPAPVSDDLFRVLEYAQKVSAMSNGAFDVSVGSLTKLWRLARRTHQMPDPEKLATARGLVGYQNIKLDAKNRTVQLLKPGMQLDLGGIAKGYSGDAVLETLAKMKITHVLLAAGGDITVGDPPPGSKGWVIGIAPLDDPKKTPSRFLMLANQAVSTSGDAEQYVEIGGKRYSHIVDPHTGLGLVGRTSATVVARHGIQSDSLTKTIAVLGPERGLKIIDGVEGAVALLVRKTDRGEEEVFTSKRFDAVTQQKTKP
ncbi:MAG TPA: FAD:protein FMN transferase [Gemmataceae bacterium]|jgi:thiamine biosynthesis lipoprotein|nr:FAD:protein FMN transferase [Gemmataceae bacterium]